MVHIWNAFFFCVALALLGLLVILRLHHKKKKTSCDTLSDPVISLYPSHLSLLLATFYPLLCRLSGLILCHFLPRCSLFLLFSTSRLLPVMWGMCYVIYPLKCTLVGSPFPCCARWIIYVNYSIERYALLTTRDLSVDLFLLPCMFLVGSLGFLESVSDVMKCISPIWNLSHFISCISI